MTVPRFQARVLVRLRPSVLDPAGEAARGAAARLGVDISKLRIGKAVELELELLMQRSAADRTAQRSAVRQSRDRGLVSRTADL